MNNFRNRLKRKYSYKNVILQDPLNTFILPFKEMPSVIMTVEQSSFRIEAHELFLHYTAHVINEDTIFSR